MANKWITQVLHGKNYKMVLGEDSIDFIEDSPHQDAVLFTIAPEDANDAHELGLMFRKAARRFEEIGKGYLNGKG